MIKRPLIIDCDPGTDDAQCIMMLNACGLFDIRGITPVHGNVPLEFTSKNSFVFKQILRNKSACLQRSRRTAYSAPASCGICTRQ